MCPSPSTPPSQLPQFDSALPSLLLLPVQLPDYNNIDSIDSENVIRFGLRNTLQTMRDGQLDKLLDWNRGDGLAAHPGPESEQSRRTVQPAGEFQRPCTPTSHSSRAPGSCWNRNRATPPTAAI
jgi:hypothetical protein